MPNILTVTHKMNDDRLHELSFDLDIVKIHCIAEHPNNESRILHWCIPGIDDENATKVADSYESLKERIWGVKE